MSVYGALAGSYDELTYDIPYETMLAFWEAVLVDAGKRPETVLDLACGTGSLSVLLAEKGYRVLGVDRAEEMLTEAMDKVADLENPPYFILQSMEKLFLPHPVDWVVCCLDGINYLTDPRDCQKTFSRVWDSLAPGGMFTFDLNSPQKLRSLDGQVWLDETEDSYCVWRTEFEKEENICYYGVDLFTRQGDLWQRDFEEHCQYAYSVEQIMEYLARAGFAKIQVYGDFTKDAPTEATQRLFFSAVKE